ncbi:hypothetical protein Nepgr_031612 [Nepenthes gracilis]|uniref:UBR-type domain-containing protein n=1 Tax=Nepenthes gracilis TaxID=150966 RepID=A0AAD3TIH5_NEPGR|nr:hypothetical protein Nepgr_031612 [Nepenthes gracilis]
MRRNSGLLELRSPSTVPISLKKAVKMADVFDEGNDSTVSIQEYLKDVEEQELEADLVLGGDEGKECTYTKGYMKRQAIFSCLTCTPDGNAGICTACSLSCHDGHEILELWTKRNFRCDCGNSKFGEFYCKLSSNKDLVNIENSYNHNFRGAYCTCGRPYPDPDAEEQEEMIQCCICEDWFHEAHLGLESSDEIPRDEDGEPIYEDLICRDCSTACSFLMLYPQHIWAAARRHDAAANAKDKGVLDELLSGCGSSHKLENNNVSSDPSEFNDSTGENSSLNYHTQDSSLRVTCLLRVDLAVDPPVLEKNKPMFLAKNWRTILCRCERCLNFFARNRIGFLLEKDDSIAEYEEMAKQKREEKLQQQEGVELSLLNKLGHVEKMEILNGIADMKNEIHSFLESFDSSRPITTADVHQVFENLAKKRRREL